MKKVKITYEDKLVSEYVRKRAGLIPTRKEG